MTADRIRGRRSPARRFWPGAALALALWLAPAAAMAEVQPLVAHGMIVDGHGQIVISRPGAMPKSVRLHGKELMLTFDQPVAVAFADDGRSLLPGYVEKVGQGRDRRTLVITLAGDYRLEAVTLGEAVVIDLYPPEAPDPANRAGNEAGEAAAPPGGGHDTPPPEPAAPAPETAATPPAPPASGAAMPGGMASAAAATEEPAGEQAAGVGVRFTAGTRAGTFRLRFDWRQPTAAAIYRRGGQFWMVFDRAAPLALDGARAEGGAAASLEQLPATQGTVARLTVEPGVHPVAWRDGYAWLVEARRGSVVPAKDIPVHAEPTAPGGARLLLTMDEPGDPLLLDDPESSERLHVVPLRRPGLGVGSDRDYPEVRLLATAQGVAVRAEADGIAVERVGDGIQITRTTGLKLSHEEGAGSRQVRWPGDRSPAPRLFDMARWRRGGAATFTSIKQELQTAVVTATRSERSRLRLELAQFYFAHGFAADALGTLKQVPASDPLFAEPAFKALLGATALLANDLELAERNLGEPALSGHPEVTLWLGLLRFRQQAWMDAAQHFADGIGLLRFEHNPYGAEFVLAAARASLEAGDLDGSTRYLDMLADSGPGKAARYEMDYLRGLGLRAAGLDEAALAHFERVVKGAKGPTRIKATVARIQLLADRGKMPYDEAIGELERLRFLWRGDEIEFAIHRALGDYYAKDKRYMQSLQSLRRAIVNFPQDLRIGELQEEMRALFARLFLDGADDEVSPFTALAIYEEFQELTPDGEAGDRMITHLVDRLVAVDLLERAGALLERQLEDRLRGPERAQVGARLARIRLQDERPERVLEALEASEIEGMPAALAVERRRLGARALARLGRKAEALALIANDRNRETEIVRAEIYWRNKDWAGAAKSLGRLADQLGVVEDELTVADSRLVLTWATALALHDDRHGMLVLRRRFDAAMEKGPNAEAYRLVTKELEGPVPDLATLAMKVREADHYEAFLTAYRQQLKEGAKQTAARRDGKPAGN